MRLHFLKRTVVIVSAVCFAIAFTACKGSESSSESGGSGTTGGAGKTPPTNQDGVFSSSKKVSDGDLVAITSSGVASNSVWFAPDGTTTFAEGTTMTKAASGTATAIATPTVLGEYRLYVVNDAGKPSPPSTAVLTVTEWVQDAYLKTSNSGGNDNFGYSVAISGDWIVIGAFQEDSSADEITNDDGLANTNNLAKNSGAAYVFKRESDGAWVQDAYLKASNNDITSDYFGYSVAISENFIVVGAHGERSNATTVENFDGSADANNSLEMAGAAYVFKREGDNWVQDAYLKAPNSEPDDRFGDPVAISGDWIVVGAFQEDSTADEITNDDGSADMDNSSPNNGAAYVFKRDATGDWIQDAYLKASNSDGGDQFGLSVAISGDLIVVGAHMEGSNATTVDNTNGSASPDDSSTVSGAAYVFKRKSKRDWIQDAYLKASNNGDHDEFGRSVAISGNLIVVGAYGEDSTADVITNTDGSASPDDSSSISGAAYVFKRDATGDWIQDAYLKASNSGKKDYFGWSVAISGDLIVVGAHKEDSTADVITNVDRSPSIDIGGPGENGAAYLFKRDVNGEWVQDAYLKASNSGSGDQFGQSVSISGNRIVVGAWGEDSGANAITNTDGSDGDNDSAKDSGAAYIFKR